MIAYWLAFFLTVALVLSHIAQPNRQERTMVWIVGIAFVVMIGLRFQVGGDWGSYKSHLALLKGLSLRESLAFGDPGYYFLNWIAAVINADIVFVNTICAIVVIVGLTRFSREQPFPWLAYLVAVPYLLIVVSMGYTRQSAALGFAMIALADLANGRQRKFVFWILLGALFHKSAVLLLPIAAVSASRNKVWTAIWVGAIGLMAVNLLLLDSADDLWRNYVEADYQSQGGLIRVAMNALPSLCFLIFRRRLVKNEAELRLWTWMAMISLATLPLVFISSTAVDRVALYFIPVQLFLFSRLPFLMRERNGFQVLTGMVISYYVLVQFVWLVFAAHSFAWLPYDNYIFHGFNPPEDNEIHCEHCLQRLL